MAPTGEEKYAAASALLIFSMAGVGNVRHVEAI